jgi:hypothetical protein
LCALRKGQLRDGRGCFAADATKERKERKAILPPEVFAKLKAKARRVWVWQKFPDELRERLEAPGKLARYVNPDFSPKKVK